MKKLLVLSCCLCLITPVFVTGCSTTANNRTAKIEAAVIPSVNIAMDLWSKRVRDGKASQAQVDMIKVIYNNYYNAQLVMKAALEKSIVNGDNATEIELNVAKASMEAAKQALLNTLQQFTK